MRLRPSVNDSSYYNGRVAIAIFEDPVGPNGPGREPLNNPFIRS